MMHTLIVDVLRNYGYADARGMGVRNKIIPLLKAHNNTEPSFIATEDHLRLIMRRGDRQGAARRPAACEPWPWALPAY